MANKNHNEPKTLWEYIRLYFPDFWQYLIIPVVAVIAWLILR